MEILGVVTCGKYMAGFINNYTTENEYLTSTIVTSFSREGQKLSTFREKIQSQFVKFFGVLFMGAMAGLFENHQF
jgi:hypothetical protein